ncbi:MAG: NAD(P)-dependent oxidoreductase, partial [Wenzhouxiangellaceae bacterium]
RLGPPDARFSLLHGADLARAIVKLIDHGPVAAIFEAAGPQPPGGWRWADIAELAERTGGSPVRTVAVPRALLATAGAAAPWWGRLRRRAAMLNPGKVRELQHDDWVCDNLSLSRATGWTPAIALETALPELPGWRAP